MSQKLSSAAVVIGALRVNKLKGNKVPGGLGVHLYFPPLLQENSALYGSHPFHFVIEEDGSSSGVFLLNSNAMGKHGSYMSSVPWN